MLVLGAYEQEDVRHRAKGSGHFKLVPRTTGQLETRLDANGEAGKNGKRIRRWVARDAAIAPREQGGLNMMDWEDHADAFQMEWITRYIAPGEAAWKEVFTASSCTITEGNAYTRRVGRSS